MAIPNELSSDIAAALLSRENRSRRELRELKDVLFTVHSTLQKLTYDRYPKSPREATAPAEKGKTE